MRPAGPPWRPLALLTGAVLLLHALGWQALPGAPAWRPAPPLVLTLRSPPSAVAPAESPAAAPAAPVARASPALAPHARPGSPPPPAQRPAVAMPFPALADGRPIGAGPLPARAARAAAPAEPAAAELPAAVPPGPVLHAAQVPDAAHWRFEVQARHRGQLLAGQGELAWRHDGAAYEARLHWSLPGQPARTQRSSGLLGAGGLAPSRYSETARGEQAAHFERSGGRIVFSTNQPDTVLEPGAQDRLSVLLQLAAFVRADPGRFPAGTAVTVQTAGVRDAGPSTFTAEGMEDLALPGGPVRAMRWSRPPRHAYDSRLDLWLGPGPDYGPVRLRLTPPHGDWLDLQWSGTDKG
jgi:hypothetical protein